MWLQSLKYFLPGSFKTVCQAAQLKCYYAILSKTSLEAKEMTQKSNDMLIVIQALSRS